MSTAFLILLLAVPGAEPDAVVVCPEIFQQALKPWVEHRTAQGHTVAVLSSEGTGRDIRARIRAAAKGGRLRFVVLIGDANTGDATDPVPPDRCVPTHYAKAEVNVLWGSEPHIATDNWYADLDDDRVPDLAIGRLTVDTPEELTRVVEKIIAYERSADFGSWRRRLNIVAGVGGFGALADTVLESTARYFLTQNIPAQYAVSMTYGSWRSPFCPDPRLFHLTTAARLNEGCWFWVYIGHGFHLGLDRVRVPGGQYHILANPDVERLDCRHGSPIALLMACYCGAFDARRDCLAEEMLRAPGAPVAVIAGSRVTMPYAMTVMGTELMDQCFHLRRPTLGEALLHAKRSMVKEADKDNQRRVMLDTVAAALSPAPKKLAAERAEHLLLFNLTGDPMLRLRHPKAVEVEVPSLIAAPPQATAGRTLEVSGTSPVEGRATIELVVRRDRLTFTPPSRRGYPQTSGELARFQECYQEANNRRLALVESTVEGGRFHARIAVPNNAAGPCHVRVFVEGPDDFALGEADLVIAERPSGSGATAGLSSSAKHNRREYTAGQASSGTRF